MAIARGRSGGINRRYADGLKLAYKFPSFTNLATGSPFVSNRYGSPVPQNGGIATGTSGLQLPPTAFSAARLTIICQFVRNDFSFGENHLLTADSYGDGNRSFQFRLSGDTVQFIGFVGNVDKSAAGTFSAAYRDTPLTVGVVHDGATTTIFGSSLGVTSVLYSGTAINAPLDTDPAYIGIGCGWASATSQYDVVRSTTHRYLLAWDRPLTLDQVAYLVTDPERAFGNPRILYFPSAGGGATIAGALESLTLSTFGATVGSSRDVAAALESLALTTSAARVSSDRAITASVESISITTSPARIASDRAVAAATEQLTVTPATASVALVSGIAAGTEALSVTANPATVALAASIAATLEAITVTGLTATVSTSSNTNISAALESITVTVNPATVSRNTALAAALESLTVTPHAASIAVGQIVAAALESLTLTSYPAGIALDVAIAAQLEQINLTTLAAQVGLGTNVAALTEALTLTPHGATLTFAPSVGAATEYITLTTFAAVVGATEAALLSPGLEFTIPLSRLGYTIPLSRVHFTIPQE